MIISMDILNSWKAQLRIERSDSETVHDCLTSVFDFVNNSAAFIGGRDVYTTEVDVPSIVLARLCVSVQEAGGRVLLYNGDIDSFVPMGQSPNYCIHEGA